MLRRIQWYGPTLVVLVVVLLVMIAGPGVIRRLEWAKTDARVVLAREDLKNNAALKELSDAYRKVAQAVEPSVVHIQVYTTRNASPGVDLRRLLPPGFPFPDDGQDDNQEPAPRHAPRDNMDKYNPAHPFGSGSGWVYDDQGHIITNYHVVRDAEEIKIKFHNSAEQQAKVVGYDEKTDVAVLKVTDTSDLHPAAMATRPEDQVQQGDIVFAFGSPFQFEFSMSQGIISGKNRQPGILRDSQGYENFLQTDAAINPGNSGGPLTNIYGQVVGMNTAIATKTGTFSGLGFAIPVNMVQDSADQIIKHGKVTRGYLGIYIRELSPKMADTFGFTGKGVLVENIIKGGPAEAAGIKRGDIVTKIDDLKTETPDQLRNYVASLKPDKKIKMAVFRDGKTSNLEATIKEMPTEAAALGPGGGSTPGEGDETRAVLRKLGLESVATLTEALARRSGLTFEPGVLVLAVRDGSTAADANIHKLSIITDVNGIKVATVEDLVHELGKQDLSKKGVRVTVVDYDSQHHERSERFEVLQLPEK